MARLSRRDFVKAMGGVGFAGLVRPPTTVAGILDMLFESRPRGPTSTITSNEDFYLTSYRSPQPFAWTSGAWL